MGKKSVFHLILSVFFLAGCAASQNIYWRSWSDWSGWKDTQKSESQPLSVSSEPSGCDVYLDNSFQGVTPLTVSLRFPVLESERSRQKVAYTESNFSAEYLLFGRGDQPRSSKVVDSEKETRTSLKDVRHELILRKSGFRAARKVVGPGQGSCSFSLVRKPCLFLDVSVVDESKITVAQNMYDTLFKKKYSKSVSWGDVQGFFLSDDVLGDAFTISESRASCEVLACSLVIRNDDSSLEVKILDAKGNASFNGSSTFRTGLEREEFLSNLKREVGRQCLNIYTKFCGE